MHEENPRCCTDCAHVSTSGGESYKCMVAFGFFGCKLMTPAEFQSPGWARTCCLFERAAPSPAPAAEAADLFNF
jgi:hypothetical protein